MIYKVSKINKNLTGEVYLTSSKSESNRVLIIRALCKNSFDIKNLAAAKDTVTMEQLLASNDELLDVGPAGTTMRFLTAYLSLQKGEHVITGSQRMKERPIGILVDALKQIGTEVTYEEKEGYPPLRISGKKLEGGTISMDGSVSSQFISALLLIAPTLEKGLVINFTGEVASKPYLNMTLRIMEYFGAKVEWRENSIKVCSGDYEAKPFTVEADWSAASYWYEIASFSDEVDFKIYGLKKESLQGDSVLSTIYESFGITTTYFDGGVHLTKKEAISLPKQWDYNFEDCPDIAQTLACTCAGLGVKGTFTGLTSLRIKETDRSLAQQIELAKLGIEVKLIGDDQLIISDGNIQMSREPIATYHDHRVAMAFAPMACVTSSVEIDDPSVVEKSYPNYWDDLSSIGFQVKEKTD